MDSEWRVIRIQEVNPSKYFIVGLDPYGSMIQITWHFHEAVITIPVVGESWLIERQGNDWFLDKRAEIDDVSTHITDLLPGDKRLEAPGTLYLNATQVLLNGQPISQGGGSVAGLSGSPGATGPTGPTGATGVIGPIGLPGIDGLDGLDGIDGMRGLIGPAGPIGPTGVTGPAGVTGATGPASAFASYTPAITTYDLGSGTVSPTLGAGSSVTGRYVQNGKMVFCWGQITFGTSGTSAGTGGYIFNLPVTAASGNNCMGSGIAQDGSANYQDFVAVFYDTTHFFPRYNGGNLVFAQSLPSGFWGANSQIFWNITYEAA